MQKIEPFWLILPSLAIAALIVNAIDAIYPLTKDNWDYICIPVYVVVRIIFAAWRMPKTTRRPL